MKTRYRIEPDHDYQFNECDGGPMPMTTDRYVGNEYHKDGVPVPYDEYLRYYGNPERHVVYGIIREDRCPCCGHWTAGDSVWGIDLMDDDPAVRMPGTYALEELSGYLREMAQELGANADLTAQATED